MPANPVIPDHESLRVIGRGSYGEVWLARSVLGTARAAKVVRRDEFRSPKPYEREFAGIQRFEPVSRSHVGLVDILQVGRNDAAGYFYYVMELADPADGTLESIAAARTPYTPRTLSSDLEKQGRLSPGDCIRVFHGLALALAHLHEAGLIHRDIKPANIIFVDGQPKFADIGLVCGADDTGSWVGTEGFIPPEGSGTPAADIYSLGKVLYEAAVGKDRREFPALPDDPDLSENTELLELNAVILRACATTPGLRFQSAREFAADLDLLQAGRSVKAARRMERRRNLARRVGLPVALAALALGGVGLGIWWARKSTPSNANPNAGAAIAPPPADSPSDLLSRARRLRVEAQPGWRAASIEALSRAAAVKPTPELRAEAIRALSGADLRPLPWRSPEGAGPILLDLDRERYVTATREGVLVFRSSRDHSELWRNDASIAPVERFVGFSGDGHWLVLADNMSALRFRRCDPGTGAWVWHSKPGGAAFGALNHDGTSALFVIPNGQLVLAPTSDMAKQVQVHSSGSAVAAEWSPDGSGIAVISDTPPAVAWLSAAGKELGGATLPGIPSAIAWSPEGTEAFIATKQGIVRAVPSAHPAVWLPQITDARCLSVDGTGRFLAIATGRQVSVWDTVGRRALATMTVATDRVSISATGRHVAIHAPGGTQVTPLEFGCGTDIVRWVSPPASDGTPLELAVGAVVVEGGAGEPAMNLPADPDAVAATRSPDGKTIRVRHADGAIAQWDRARLRERLGSLGLGW